jgi:hypothetical protein
VPVVFRQRARGFHDRIRLANVNKGVAEGAGRLVIHPYTT